MKKIMLIFAMILSLQLNGAAGLRQYIPQAGRQFITRLQQPTQRFLATQTPRFTCPTGRCASFKNMFSGTQRQFSNAWSQYRKPVALGALGLGGAGCYNWLQNRPALAEENASRNFFKSDMLDFALEIGSKSGFGSPGSRMYFYMTKDENPRDFLSMLIHDIDKYLTGSKIHKRGMSRTEEVNIVDILDEAVIAENIRGADKERNSMYQDIVRLMGRLYATKESYTLEKNIKEFFENTSHFAIPRVDNEATRPLRMFGQTARNFGQKINNALEAMLNNPSAYNITDEELRVLQKIKELIPKE